MFVDYHLVDMTGMEVVSSLMKSHNWKRDSTIMVLVTGESENIALFDRYFTDRLLKPVNLPRFNDVMKVIMPT